MATSFITGVKKGSSYHFSKNFLSVLNLLGMNHCQSDCCCLMDTIYQNRRALSRKIYCEMIVFRKKQPTKKTYGQKKSIQFPEWIVSLVT